MKEEVVRDSLVEHQSFLRKLGILQLRRDLLAPKRSSFEAFSQASFARAIWKYTLTSGDDRISVRECTW